MLHFTDGIVVDTDGPPRRVELSDGLYVAGKGMLIPCASEEEVKEILAELAAEKKS